MRLREIIGDVEVQIFHKGLRPAGKTGEIDLKNLEGQAWVSLVEAEVAGVAEDPATGAVTVRRAAGGEAVFDLVVLAVGVRARRDFRRFARVGGAALDKYGFVDSSVAAQIAWRPGVAFAGSIRGPQRNGQAVADAIAGASRALGAIAGAEPAGASAAVIGAGVAGLAAAAELLRRGVKPVIIEKSGSAGGRLAGTAPELIESVRAHPGARLIEGAEVVSVERLPGAGKIRLGISAGARVETADVGVLVIATGTGPYIPVGWRASADPVITQEHLASALAGGAVPWKKVVMLQCVGARDEAHPYCGRFCCRQALANALALKDADPAAEITILHRGIRVFGADEELYTGALERGVKLVDIRGTPTLEEGEPFKVHAERAGGEGLCLECDVVVLSVAATDNQEVRKVAAAVGVPLDDLGLVATGNPLEDPFATGMPGVFVCGSARSPVTVEEAFADGVGAAGAVCSYLGGG
jgi:heterodisulfide reductase subunit A